MLNKYSKKLLVALLIVTAFFALSVFAVSAAQDNNKDNQNNYNNSDNNHSNDDRHTTPTPTPTPKHEDCDDNNYKRGHEDKCAKPTPTPTPKHEDCDDDNYKRGHHDKCDNKPSVTPIPTVTPCVSPTVTPMPTVTPSVSPIPTPTQTPSNNNGGGSSGGGSAPSCGNQKPNQPSNLIATAGPGAGQVTLTWGAPSGSVTDYSITYSDDPSTQKWGVVSTGNVTTYTISGLGVNKYYFWIKAVNGCMPGDPIGPTTVGGTGGPAVLGASTGPQVLGLSTTSGEENYLLQFVQLFGSLTSAGLGFIFLKKHA